MVAFVLTRTVGTVLILTIGIKAFCITFVSAKQVSQDQTVKVLSHRGFALNEGSVVLENAFVKTGLL